MNRVALGHRLPQSVEDARNRKVESRMRNKSQERGMGMITRGGHQYNHKRHICMHCGSGRSIKLDEYDGDDDAKPGDRPPPPTRKVDNRPLLLLAKGSVASSVEDKGRGKGNDGPDSSSSAAAAVTSFPVSDNDLAVGSPPASATKSSGGGSGDGRPRPRGRPPKSAPQTPTPLGGEDGSNHPDLLLGGYSDLGSQSDCSAERDDDDSDSHTASRNNTHKPSPAAAFTRTPILESDISSEADFKESSRPGKRLNTRSTQSHAQRKLSLLV